MTDQLRQAAQQALEALEAITRSVQSDHQAEIAEDAITALRTALVQQAEPVAWAVQACSKMWRGEFAEIDAKAEAKRIGGTCVAFPLYTTPPQRPWVGLTDEEMSDIVADIDVDFGDLLWKVVCLTKIIQATIKERNT